MGATLIARPKCRLIAEGYYGHRFGARAKGGDGSHVEFVVFGRGPLVPIIVGSHANDGDFGVL